MPYVSLRERLAFFLPPATAAFATLAVFLEGAALAIWSEGGCAGGGRAGRPERDFRPRGCSDGRPPGPRPSPLAAARKRMFWERALGMEGDCYCS